jgi:hypothetical protein
LQDDSLPELALQEQQEQSRRPFSLFSILLIPQPQDDGVRVRHISRDVKPELPAVRNPHRIAKPRHEAFARCLFKFPATFG